MTFNVIWESLKQFLSLTSLEDIEACALTIYYAIVQKILFPWKSKEEGTTVVS